MAASTASASVLLGSVVISESQRNAVSGTCCRNTCAHSLALDSLPGSVNRSAKMSCSILCRSNKRTARSALRASIELLSPLQAVSGLQALLLERCYRLVLMHIYLCAGTRAVATLLPSPQLLAASSTVRLQPTAAVGLPVEASMPQLVPCESVATSTMLPSRQRDPLARHVTAARYLVATGIICGKLCAEACRADLLRAGAENLLNAHHHDHPELKPYFMQGHGRTAAERA